MVWPQNYWDCFLWFGFKTIGDGFLRFGLKTGSDGFLRFGQKTGGDNFSGFTSNPVATVSWLSLKTNVVEGFLV
jgi:hypothetical protein